MSNAVATAAEDTPLHGFIAYRGRPSCRPIFLLAFLLATSAVVALDRYITVEGVKLCETSNLYNCKELAQIRATQNAQVCVGYGLRIAEALVDELQTEKRVSSMTAQMCQSLAQENRQLSHCQTVIAKYNDKLIQLLNEKGIDLPEPDAEPSFNAPLFPPIGPPSAPPTPAAPVETDRTT